MTIQRKQFVELEDVAAVVVRCKNCSTAVSFPPSTSVKYSRLEDCPNCGDEWIGSTDPLTIGRKFADFNKALAEFGEFMKARKEREKGFTFALELKASDPASSNRDA